MSDQDIVMAPPAVARGKIAGPSEPRAYVEWLARRRIAGFVGTIDEHGEYLSEIYPGSASMGDSIAADYHGRFLIELIQNANDVHPDGLSDGAIDIVLDLSAAGPGILYIANKGAPFARKNVKALCDMGLSSKPPGESIGNKGLGFRSVYHISAAPCIYSRRTQAPGGDHFDGYCFRFADEADLEHLIDDPRKRALARKDLPIFHVPIWLDDQPDTVRAFAQRGFATVIALPLRSPAATLEVQSQIAAVRSQPYPLLLFLTRLQRLAITIIDERGEPDDVAPLTRYEAALASGLSIAELGSAGRYLLARRQVPEAAMKTAIRDGTENKQLHKHWAAWEGQGDVALAVRLDGPVTAGRLYTFLPMGEQAISPFAGYLHGSFFPTSNRKGLDASVALNALLLDVAADLAAEAILHLATATPSVKLALLTHDERARAVVDLLVWRKVESLATTQDLGAALAARLVARAETGSLSDVAMVPVLTDAADAIGWAPPAIVRRWRHSLESFDAASAAAHAAATQIHPFWPGLDARIDALVTFLTRYAPGFIEVPTAAERARLVVEVAAELAAARRAPLSRWRAFYRDVPKLLEGSGSALAGLPILWCDEAGLCAAMQVVPEVEGQSKRRKRAQMPVSVFSPPGRRGATDDLVARKLPEALAGNFAFLSSGLDWHGELSEAREFLEKAKLVFAFDREELVTQIARMVQADGRNAIRTAGLRWAFQIWREPRETGRGFRLQAQHRLMVPTQGQTFIDARQAIFSHSWPEETQGRLLQRFLDAAPPDSADIKAVADRRIADRSHYAFKGSRPELWAAFLAELGVQQGLVPLRKKVSGATAGWRIRDFAFCPTIGIPADAAARWKADILAEDSTALALKPGSSYMMSGDLLWMPGQGDFPDFSRECREYYAQLLIAWLAGPMPRLWTVDVYHHHFKYDDARLWPTPLKAFLQSAEWIPAEAPAPDGAHKLSLTAAQTWVAGEIGERFPSFLRRPAPAVMRMLDRATAPHLAKLREHSGLKIFGDPDTLVDQADFLAQQLASDGFDRYFERHLLNLYHETWRQIASLPADADPAADRVPDKLIVRIHHQARVVALADLAADAPIYVRDCDDETGASLVEAAGLPWFDPKQSDPKRIGTFMRAHYGERVRLLSEARYEMIIDGAPVGDGTVIPVLDLCPRLRLMCAVAMEGLKGAEHQRLPADRHAVVARLERVVIQQAGAISFRIDGIDIDGDLAERHAFAVKAADGRQVVVARRGGAPDWLELDALLGAVCEAIGLPGLEANMRLLVTLQLRDALDLSGQPDLAAEIDRLSAMLRLGDAARRTVRETLGAQLERHLPWLRAILHLAGGQDAVDALHSVETIAVQDAGRLREAIAPWLGAIGRDADAVLDACRTALTTAELREVLDFDFASWNASLIAVGEAPDRYPEVHARQMAQYLRDHGRAVIDALRAVHIAKLKAGSSAPEYALQKAEAFALVADPDWQDRYLEVPDKLLAVRVDAWLAARGAPTLDHVGALNLEPLDQTRDANAALLRKLASAAAPLVRAWCAKAQVPLPRPWLESDAGYGSIRGQLESAGIFEAYALDEKELLAWLARLWIWPASMPQCLDTITLGISEEDLDADRIQAQQKAEQRKREARSIPFNGRDLDPVCLDWQAISSELAASLSRKTLNMPVGSAAKLQPARRRSTGGAGGGGGGSSGAYHPVPSEKTDLIGQLGEVAVYHWLRGKLPDQDIDAAWVSGTGKLITNQEGRDGLGYDFDIAYRGQRWQIEVKTSLNDPCAFQMGETEVRAGRAAARARSGVQYWIAYVSNIGTPAATRIEMLPNPLSEEGERVLDLVGHGLRYQFRR